ncbi:MAG TPA: hypothetical protein PLU22_00700 [Polyangiaceae bacterium]|nr:hypothetical protein [Polyangiaceae bacterium]
MSLSHLLGDRVPRQALERRVGALLRSPRTTLLITRIIAATGALHERFAGPTAWHHAARASATAAREALRSAIDRARHLTRARRHGRPRAGGSAEGSGPGSGGKTGD